MKKIEVADFVKEKCDQWRKISRLNRPSPQKWIQRQLQEIHQDYFQAETKNCDALKMKQIVLKNFPHQIICVLNLIHEHFLVQVQGVKPKPVQEYHICLPPVLTPESTLANFIALIQDYFVKNWLLFPRIINRNLLKNLLSQNLESLVAQNWYVFAAFQDQIHHPCLDCILWTFLNCELYLADETIHEKEDIFLLSPTLKKMITQSLQHSICPTWICPNRKR